MKSKKIICFLLSVIIVAGLSACTKNSPNFIENCYTYNLDDYITLGQYKNLEIEVPSTKATEQDIEDAMELLIEEYITYEETDRTVVQNGDKVIISYVGSMDGVEQASMSATNAELIIGSHSYIGTFEEQLIGASVGQTVTVIATFPENYKSKPSYSGKDGVFVTTVNKIYAKNVPKLTDEFIRAKTDYANIEAFRKAAEEAIIQSKIEENKSQFANMIWQTIINTSTIKKYPQTVVQSIIKDTKETIEYYAEHYYGMTFEEYVKGSGFDSVEEFDEYNRQNSENIVRNRLVIYAIAAAENISISADEYNVLAGEYAAEAGYSSVEELEKAYLKEDIVTDMARTKVIEFLEANSTMKEKEE